MISELFGKYQFGALHTADISDGKVMNRAVCSAESELFRGLLHRSPLCRRQPTQLFVHNLTIGDIVNAQTVDDIL